MKKGEILITDKVVLDKIYLVRGQKVMIDRDLANLYGVETKRLKEVVKRNIERFPEDFMFEMTKDEFIIGGRKLRPPIPKKWDCGMLLFVLQKKV